MSINKEQSFVLEMQANIDKYGETNFTHVYSTAPQLNILKLCRVPKAHLHLFSRLLWFEIILWLQQVPCLL